jgi:hypothetical protein
MFPDRASASPEVDKAKTIVSVVKRFISNFLFRLKKHHQQIGELHGQYQEHGILTSVTPIHGGRLRTAKWFQQPCVFFGSRADEAVDIPPAPRTSTKAVL